MTFMCELNPIHPGETPDVQINLRRCFQKLSRGRQTDRQVMRGHFRSRDKDSGHTMRPPTHSQKPHATRKPDGSIFYRTGVMSNRNLHYGNRHSGRSAPLTLIIHDPMTFMYELDPYCVEIYRICKYEFFESYCPRYGQTDRQSRPKL